MLVGMFIGRSNQLALFMAISTSSFADVLSRVLDLAASDEWILRSSKPCMAREVVTPVPCFMHCDG